MSLLGFKMAMISDITPIVLIAVGSAYGIHFINKFLEEKKSNNFDKEQLIKKTIKDVGVPIILAGLTTMAGFFSFLTANLAMTQEFGVFTGIGVLFALILSITFVPAVILKTGMYEFEKNNKTEHISIFHRGMSYIGEKITSYKWLVLIIFFAVSLLSIKYALKVTREVNMEKYFTEDSEVRKASSYVKARFGGSIPMQVYVESDYIKTPFVLKQILYIEKFLSSVSDIHNPRSVSDLICELNKIMTGYYAVPDSEEKIGNLWFFLDGQESLEQMINSDEDKAIIQATTPSMDTKDMVAHQKFISEFLNKNINIPYIEVNINAYPEKKREILDLIVSRIADYIFLDLKSETKVIETDDEQYAARAVIIATGRQPIKLQIAKDNPHIHYCAICDGTMYKNRNVLVVGGGNSGVGDALYLLDQGVSRITLVEQMDGLLASAKDQHRLYSYENVKVLTCREVVGIDTRDDEICVTLKNTKNGKTELIDVCGIFVYIGQKPQTDLFKDVLEMDPDGYLIAGDNMETNIQGIFVAGDVRQKKVRQLTTATSDGTIAALSAVEHIHSL
jgi:thioredoxin reductase (NADPH)